MHPTKTRSSRIISLIAASVLAAAGLVRAAEIPLSTLDLSTAKQSSGQPAAKTSASNTPITINGVVFQDGIGSRAGFKWQIETAGNADRFTATVGMDDAARPPASTRPATTQQGRRGRGATVEFKVIADGKIVFKSGAMRPGDAGKPVDVDLKGVKNLVLVANSAGGQQNQNAFADWADAKLIASTDAKPRTVAFPVEEETILTPPAPATPRINGAAVVGVRPTHPVIFTIPATGDRPMKFAVDNLPEGLKLDAETGIITGNVAKAGSYAVKFHATNDKGSADKDFKFEIGDTIALTPQLGWNSWNCFAGTVSDEKIRQSADAFVKDGFINHGWTYINIDDCWEISTRDPNAKLRNDDGTIITNNKFPDMKGLADYVHSKGLKIGIYSSPGPSTCGSFTASYQHEAQDAKTYADWGFDYLKYDWCSYGNVANEIRRAPNPPSALEIAQKPYKVMADALKAQNRDILFSFCQYGNENVWEWGAGLGGNSWRTTGDIVDNWQSMSTIGFNQNGHEKFAGPGHWNDPDMLVVGKVGWGGQLRKTNLTPNEQYTHITLWSMLNSPLLIGCDLTQIEPFTLSLLTNDEVLAVNQDVLGQQAHRVVQNTENDSEIWMKDMADGSKIVGVFNRNEVALTIPIKWSELGLKNPKNVRDLWRQKDVSASGESLSVEVPTHGAMMYQIRQ